ncbi:hypothetical protein DOTSEDRAFT_24555 [Dothistroma septosporum NZE10]|uniref:Uncharacterized protein n=1 Tax=Dothistroma septosporum (strain NZE10 / CBS 128990) TaxID=675120 RepID=N1PMB9_DOTSN|nr:hypothetical protein DOTSEDRAFT_24555 [Dothistroma septosporum NZE10]
MAGPFRHNHAGPPTSWNKLPEDTQGYVTKKLTKVVSPSTTVYAEYDRVRSLQFYQGAVLHLPIHQLFCDNYKVHVGEPHLEFSTEAYGRKNDERFDDGWLYAIPILVLSRPADDPGRIRFCPTTTCGSQSVQEKFTGESGQRKWQYYLAVDPTENYPIETHPTLYYDSDRRTRKSGYVRMNVVYAMHYVDAIRFLGGYRQQDKIDPRP